MVSQRKIGPHSAPEPTWGPHGSPVPFNACRDSARFPRRRTSGESRRNAVFPRSRDIAIRRDFPDEEHRENRAPRAIPDMSRCRDFPDLLYLWVKVFLKCIDGLKHQLESFYHEN